MTKPIKSRMRAVEEGQFYQFGVYLWKMPDGSYVADDQRNFLNIPAQRGDIARIGKLRDVVKSFGIVEGEPEFFAGHRQVTDEEYEEQKERLKAGYIPDQYDLPAIVEDIRDNQRQQRN